jgi:hypothetical protein
LAATLTATALAKEPPGRKEFRPPSRGLIEAWFTGKNAPPRKPNKAAERVREEEAEVRPTKVDETAANRAVEEAAYLRRLQVCTKLREVAVQTNDVDLERLVDQLEERVWNVYAQRTLNLSAGKANLESAGGPAEKKAAATASKRPSRRSESEATSDEPIIHAVPAEEKP